MPVRHGVIALVVGLCIQTGAMATTINDIRIEGLQRVSADSIFAVLPIDIGQKVDSRQVALASRAIFATGNFQDIEIGIDGGVLVITLKERPSISEINIEGNKAIETEALLDGLKNQGMTEGRVFQRATLEGMRRELARQYGAQGRYDSEITTDIVAKPRNRVAVDIFIDEGSVAKIKQINIVGNEIYSDKELRGLMELKDRGFFNGFKGRKKYAREKLSGDIETITDFYLNRGYIQFAMRSTQVSVGPTKDSVYITINVDEGEPFKINKVQLDGDVKDQADTLGRVFMLSKGNTFSQASVTRTEELMKRVMGNQGYAFAEINSIPEVNAEDKTVDITFFVDPGKRTYVRSIEFEGNFKTADEVLRREMRQMEGGLASTNLIELSRVRLERLGFFKEAKVETSKVPGVDDLIDVRYRVEEQSSGSVSASVGFSQDVGLIFGADFQQNNFLGSGKQVGIQANRSRFRTTYGLNYINPYYTEDGVSRGFNLFFSETNFDEINVASYSTNRYGGSVIFGYPINETQSLRFSLGYTNTEIEAGFAAVQEIMRTPTIPPNTNINDYDEVGFVDKYGSKFDVFLLNGSWRESTLNRGILADRGHSNNLSLEVTAPGSEIEYFRVTYDTQYFVPIGPVTLRFRGEVGYGDGLADTDELPFFEHFLAGGFGSVRGFESNTLGPRSTSARAPQFEGDIEGLPIDPSPDPFGGNFLFEGSVELLLPLPFLKDQRSVRAVLFYDYGNVFSDNCRSGQLNCSEFDLGELRTSAGLAVTWLSGFGPLSFSLGSPLQHNDVDDREIFQFSLGSAF
ncbi:MAG: outer membrane protein assembly factor BamA [Pseudomonadales bacterium]|nr:outer membrane protein assembly factor BamA [Pseudomonadales bacterium]